MDQFLTTWQFAKALKISPTTVLMMIYRGRLPAQKVGNRFEIDPLELDLWEKYKHKKVFRMRRKGVSE